MYLHSAALGQAAKELAAEKPPFGPGLSTEAAQQAARVEVWATAFSDSGEYTEFRVWDAHERQIATVRVNGY